MIVLDTTVLVYAVGSEHPLRAPCRELIDAIAAGRVRATTTVEVLQEFAHVRARGRDHLDLLAPLLVVGEDDLREGMRLFARGERLGAFDAVLAAAASRANADALVSADAAFAEAGLAHVVPHAEGVAALLGAWAAGSGRSRPATPPRRRSAPSTAASRCCVDPSRSTASSRSPISSTGCRSPKE